MCYGHLKSFYIVFTVAPISYKSVKVPEEKTTKNRKQKQKQKEEEEEEEEKKRRYMCVRSGVSISSSDDVE